MTDATSDAMGAIVPLVGLGIVANMAGNMMRGPTRTRTITRTRTVYRNKVKGVSPVKHHHHKHRETSFFG